MWISCPSQIIVFLCTFFLRAVSARLCGNESDVTGIVVYSQLDADTKLQGCDTLAANLVIGHNYTGELVLNGLTNITASFMTSPGYWWAAPGETQEGSPGLTSIVANDLLEVGSYGLDLSNATSLISARFDKLQKAYELRINLDTDGGSLDFPALETVTRGMRVSGNISSMDFSSLARVGGAMDILSRSGFSYIYMLSLNLGTNSPLSVNFPSLVNCSSLTIAGNISQLSMPLLTTVGQTIGNRQFSSYDDGDLEIYTQGAPLDLNLPSLWNVSDVTLAGTFANISFPALHHLAKDYRLRSQLPLSINLAPLESASVVFLSGNLTSYNVSSLRYVNQTLSIDNDEPLDCDPGRQKWLQLRPQYSSYKSDQKLPDYYCFEKKHKPFPKLEVGLGVGLGVPAFLLFVFFIWRAARFNKREQETKINHLPDYETEMETRRTGGGEPLPEYVPRENHEDTRRASAVSSLSDMARPTTERPPGYDATHPRGGATAAET